MRKHQRYIIKFGRVILPRAKYHSTKKGARGYDRARMKRLTRRESRDDRAVKSSICCKSGWA